MGQISTNLPTPPAGTQAEQYIAWLSATCCFAEYVYPNPKYMRGGQEKELCDVLIEWRDILVVVQIKAADPETHAQFTQEKKFRWAQKRLNEAIKQSRGAIGAIHKGLITSVTNDRRGHLRLRNYREYNVFTIQVIEHIHPDNINCTFSLQSGPIDAPTLTLTPREFQETMLELSTIADLREYLLFRKAWVGRITMTGNSELDLLAFYKQRRDITDANEIPEGLVLGDDIWEEYAVSEHRKEKHRLDRESLLIDFIAHDLAQSRDHPSSGFDFDLINDPTTPRSNSYLRVLNALAHLRRIDRRIIGERLMDKIYNCDNKNPVRYFGIPLDGSCYFFLVTDKNREERCQILANLLSQLMVEYKCMKGFGIALNSAQHDPADSCIDACAVDLNDLSPKHRNELLQTRPMKGLFEVRRIKADEYPSQSTKDGVDPP